MPPSAAARFLRLVIRAYQIALSPLFAGACRHVPSCSAYASDAVLIHGALGGSWLAIRRLSRCRPFGTYGFDPVPPARGRSAGVKSPA